VNDDRITHAQLSRLTGTRDNHTRPPVRELHTDVTCVDEAGGVRGRFERGDRVALEHTDDPHTRLRPGDEGTVTGYDPRLGQLAVRWDDGSSLAMLLHDGDRAHLITPAGEHPGRDGQDPA